MVERTEPYGRQEAFDIVASHLLTQNKKAKTKVDGEWVCRYRTDDGLMCAFGCLIPDELYSIDIEGAAAGWLIKNSGRFRSLFADADWLFYRALQRCHDDWPPSRWKIRLRAIGKENDLNIDVLR